MTEYMILFGLVIIAYSIYRIRQNALFNQSPYKPYTELRTVRDSKYLRTKSKVELAKELNAKDARIYELNRQISQLTHNNNVLKDTKSLEDNEHYQKCALVIDKVIGALTAYEDMKSEVSAEDTLDLLKFNLVQILDLKYTYNAEARKTIKQVINNIRNFKGSKKSKAYTY